MSKLDQPKTVRLLSRVRYRLPFGILLLATSMLSQSVLSKNFYRYKTDEGAIEVVDKINKAMELNGYEVISEKGIVLKKVPPTKTLAQLEEDRLRKIEERNKEIALEQQIRRDADLLRQFASVSDIIQNRDNQILALEQRIRIQNSKAGLLHLQLEDQQAQAATYERLGQKVAKTLLNDISDTRDQIDNNATNTKLLEKEKIRVEKRFENDIVRFKDLEDVRRALRKNAAKKDGTEPVIYDCVDDESCTRAWQLAQIYARDNATGKLEIITNTLILTSRPSKDSDIALSFSKIPAPDKKIQIVLEVSCNATEAGSAFCVTPQIKDIRRNYLKYVRSRMNKP